jgi:hypothetical protein
MSVSPCRSWVSWSTSCAPQASAQQSACSSWSTLQQTSVLSQGGCIQRASSTHTLPACLSLHQQTACLTARSSDCRQHA